MVNSSKIDTAKHKNVVLIPPFFSSSLQLFIRRCILLNVSQEMSQAISIVIFFFNRMDPEGCGHTIAPFQTILREKQSGTFLTSLSQVRLPCATSCAPAKCLMRRKLVEEVKPPLQHQLLILTPTFTKSWIPYRCNPDIGCKLSTSKLIFVCFINNKIT